MKETLFAIADLAIQIEWIILYYLFGLCGSDGVAGNVRGVCCIPDEH